MITAISVDFPLSMISDYWSIDWSTHHQRFLGKSSNKSKFADHRRCSISIMTLEMVIKTLELPPAGGELSGEVLETAIKLEMKMICPSHYSSNMLQNSIYSTWHLLTYIPSSTIIMQIWKWNIKWECSIKLMHSTSTHFLI